MWQHLIIAQGGAQAPGWVQFIPWIAVALVFWFLLIRPQQKRQREHESFLNSLKKGDRVVTAGGVFGTVDKVDGQVIRLRISRDTKIKVLRQQIEGSQASFLRDEDEEEEKEQESDKGADEDNESGDAKESKSL